MATDVSNLNWLRSQYWFIVGQLQQRDTGFELPFTSAEIEQVDEHRLSRVVADLKRLASIPPSR